MKTAKLVLLMMLCLLLAQPVLENGCFAKAVNAVKKVGWEPSQQTTLNDLPQALKYQVSASMGKNQPDYHAKKQGDGYLADNPNQDYLVQFNEQGMILNAGGARLGFILSGVGYGDLSSPAVAATPIAKDNRIEYQRGNVTEWYVNGPLGLQQGFTLQERPEISSTSALRELRLELTVTDGWQADLANSEQDLKLIAEDGFSLNYSGLIAYDANNKELPARFTINQNSDIVHILVDDFGANYPITIDPFIQQAYLKASNAEASDYFGRSVAISGDYAVVGAYKEDSDGSSEGDNSALSAGAAYVFNRSGTTWTQQAYLKASNAEVNDWFGNSVAISGDYAVVSAYLEDSNGADGEGDNSASGAGAAYMFFNGTPPTLPEIDVQRPAGTSIPDGGTDDVGNQSVGTVNLTYTIDNSAGTAQLDVTAATASNLSNCRNFTVVTTLPLNIAAAGTATLEVSFAVDATGAFSFDMDIANNDGDENPYTFAIQGTGTEAVAPEIDVLGSSISIADGDDHTATQDDTDFGNADVTSDAVDHTFTIKNTGTANLNLTGTSKVVIGGTHAGDFSVTLQPTSPVSSGGGTTTFTVRFNPSALGLRTATISIDNDDADENPYTFAIQGTGTEKDSDGDGIPDSQENDCEPQPCDRDGDGILDSEDYDPAGWIYDETNGNIISGGTITVTPSTGVNIIENGSNGYYQFTVSQSGDYTLSYSPPSGFNLSSICTAQSTRLDIEPTDPNPYVVGDGSKDGANNQMTNWVCGDNPYYWEFHLEIGDPIIINNNIPLESHSTNIVLSAFYAEVGQDGIIINWTTETEPNNAGFNIFRSDAENGSYNKVNETLIKALGNTTTGASYNFVDKPGQAGNYYYKLQSVSLDGSTGFNGPIFVGLTSVDLKKYAVPDKYSLSQNYPNPFNPETTIEYALPKSGFVEITIFDTNGKLVRQLVSGQQQVGNHWVKWNGRNDSGTQVSSGVYFAKMKAGAFRQTNKMILMK